MRNKRLGTIAATLALIGWLCGSVPMAWGEGSVGLINKVQSVFGLSPSSTVAASGSIEVAFSPNEGAEALVLKVIASARREIKVLAYSFTSGSVVRALLDAKRRGVAVTVVVDHKGNISNDPKSKSRAALSALATAGVDVRTISVYAIHHDKLILVDGITVQTGSFNYSAAAASKNSENVLVHWNNPALEQVYGAHFQRNYRQSESFMAQY